MVYLLLTVLCLDYKSAVGGFDNAALDSNGDIIESIQFRPYKLYPNDKTLYTPYCNYDFTNSFTNFIPNSVFFENFSLREGVSISNALCFRM